MLEIIKKLFGIGPSVDFAQLAREGAIILDVRTKAEFQGGHIKGSINIPVNSLEASQSKLKEKDRPIITCCASGIRSGSAVRILKGQGFTKVYNGGSWASLRNSLN